MAMDRLMMSGLTQQEEEIFNVEQDIKDEQSMISQHRSGIAQLTDLLK